MNMIILIAAALGTTLPCLAISATDLRPRT